MEGRTSDVRRNSADYEPYIRIPSDLFGERLNRIAPSVRLPTNFEGRSAGVYPPPRPVPRLEPWSLQSCRGGVRMGCESDYPLLERYHRMLGMDLGSNRTSTSCHFCDFGCRPKNIRGQRAACFASCHQVKGRSSGENEDTMLMQTTSQVVKETRRWRKGGDTEGEYLDSLIDLVARANDVHVQPGCSHLPSLQAGPCAMHDRQDQQRRSQLLYATHCHGGKVPPTQATRNKSLSSSTHYRHSSETNQQGFHYNGGGSDCSPAETGEEARRSREVSRKNQEKNEILLGLGKSTRQNPKEPQKRHMPPGLPEELPTEEIVMSWLKNGSFPLGCSHFPDVMQPSTVSSSRQQSKPHGFAEQKIS